MWFFAVLVVLAMGGVAAVAAGFGRPLAVEYDDRPDVTVPADRVLGEPDVRRVRFSTALLGYRQSEVDALLERLASELGRRDDPAVGVGDEPPPGLVALVERARGAERPVGLVALVEQAREEERPPSLVALAKLAQDEERPPALVELAERARDARGDGPGKV